MNSSTCKIYNQQIIVSYWLFGVTALFTTVIILKYYILIMYHVVVLIITFALFLLFAILKVSYMMPEIFEQKMLAVTIKGTGKCMRTHLQF